MDHRFNRLRDLESALEMFQRMALSDTEPYRGAFLPKAYKEYLAEAEALVRDLELYPYEKKRAKDVRDGFRQLVDRDS